MVRRVVQEAQEAVAVTEVWVVQPVPEVSVVLRVQLLSREQVA
jgi:hypothetical protein